MGSVIRTCSIKMLEWAIATADISLCYVQLSEVHVVGPLFRATFFFNLYLLFAIFAKVCCIC